MQWFYHNLHRMKIDRGGDGRRRGAGRRQGNWWGVTHMQSDNSQRVCWDQKRIRADQIGLSMPNVTWGWDRWSSIFNCSDAFRLWCMCSDTDTNVGEEKSMNGKAELITTDREWREARRTLGTETLFCGSFSPSHISCLNILHQCVSKQTFPPQVKPVIILSQKC